MIITIYYHPAETWTPIDFLLELQSLPKFFFFFFSNMFNLRLLIVDNVSVSNYLNYLPIDMRFLDWFEYCSKIFAICFQPK